MTTNETFFFRDKIPFDHFRDVIMPALMPARASAPYPAHLVRGRLHRAGALFARDVRSRNGRALAGWRIEIVATDLSQRGAGEGQGRHLQPVRGAARPADPVAGQIFHAGRRHVADRAGYPRHGAAFRQLNLLHDFSHLGTFDVIFCRNVLIYFDQETKSRRVRPPCAGDRPDGFLVLGAAESVVGMSEASNLSRPARPYRPNADRTTRAGAAALRPPLGFEQ